VVATYKEFRRRFGCFGVRLGVYEFLRLC